MTTAATEAAWWNGHAVGDYRVAVADHWDPAGIRQFVSIIDDEIRPAARPRNHPYLLDLGCGVGRLSMPMRLVYPAATILGVDVSDEMIKRAQIDARSEDAHRQCRFELGDGRAIPANECSVHGGWSVCCFQHVEADTVRGYIAEIARVLTADGRFVFQYVDGSNDAPFSHDHRLDVILGWCFDAGLWVGNVRRGVYDQWRWVTVVQP